MWEWHKRSLRVNTRLQRESAINTIQILRIGVRLWVRVGVRVWVRVMVMVRVRVSVVLWSG